MKRKSFQIKVYGKRRRSYVLTSAAFTAAVIAVVIMLNVIVSALFTGKLWYIDMTKEQVYSLSDEAKSALADVTEPVGIYFAMEPDKLMNGDNQYMKYIYQTALQLAEAFDNITVTCTDIVKYPDAFRDFYSTLNTSIISTSVIVASGSEVRLHRAESFFITDTDSGKTWAYDGEYRFASAILQLTATSSPVVCFTTGHGETIGNDAGAMRAQFEGAGYTIADVDLSTADIPEDTRIVVINDPVYDFAGIESGDARSNEISKIDAFLDDFGSLMMFTSPENAGNLTNLSELIAEWGIAFTPNTFVRDYSNSVSHDGTEVVGNYHDGTLGAELYSELSELDTMPKTVLKNAMPLQILWETGSMASLYGSRMASAVVSSYDTAKLVTADGETDAGEVPLMTFSSESRLIDEQRYYSYVFVCGSDMFAGGSADGKDTSYLNTNAYANRDILAYTMQLTGRERILADIDEKVFDDTQLTITTEVANRWTVWLVTALPVIITAAGIFVRIRRKSS